MDHYDPKNTEQHFFASTKLTWATAPDPVTAVQKAVASAGKPVIEDEGVYVLIAWVPVAEKAGYRIEGFVPQVEGATVIYGGFVPLPMGKKSRR